MLKKIINANRYTYQIMGNFTLQLTVGQSQVKSQENHNFNQIQ